jgi:hypothetical protein
VPMRGSADVPTRAGYGLVVGKILRWPSDHEKDE